MKLNISDLLDGLEENVIPIRSKPVASAKRIKELTMKKIETQAPRRKTGAPGGWKRMLTLAAVAVMILALGVTAYALISHQEFFRNAYGTGIEGQEARSEDVLTPDGDVLKTEHFPAEERVENDPEKTEELIGSYVSPVGFRLTLADYTITVEDVVLDANGIGAVSVLVENPKGHSFRGDDQLHYPYLGCCVRGSGETLISFRDFPVEGSDTGTSIRQVYYLCPAGALGAEEDVLLNFSVIGEAGELASGCVMIPAAERVPLTALRSEGAEAELSPVGLHLRYTFDPGFSGEVWYQEYVESEITVCFRDGSSYTVKGADVINSPVSTQHDGQLWLAFNRVVDPAEVTEIRITGSLMVETSETNGTQEKSYSITLTKG